MTSNKTLDNLAMNLAATKFLNLYETELHDVGTEMKQEMLLLASAENDDVEKYTREINTLTAYNNLLKLFISGFRQSASMLNFSITASTIKIPDAFIDYAPSIVNYICNRLIGLYNNYFKTSTKSVALDTATMQYDDATIDELRLKLSSISICLSTMSKRITELQEIKNDIKGNTNI